MLIYTVDFTNLVYWQSLILPIYPDHTPYDPILYDPILYDPILYAIILKFNGITFGNLF